MLSEVAGYVGLLHEPVVQDDLVEAVTEIVDLGPPGRRVPSTAASTEIAGVMTPSPYSEAAPNSPTST